MECKNRSDTRNNNRFICNQLTNIHLGNKHTCTARNQGTTENSHIGHCTHTAERTDVRVEEFTTENGTAFRPP